MTEITMSHEGKTYTMQSMKNGCEGCVFNDYANRECSAPSGFACELDCLGHEIIWIEQKPTNTACCGQPNTCAQPCFHASGRTTPGRPGAISGKPNPTQFDDDHIIIEVEMPTDLIERIDIQAEFQGIARDEWLEAALEVVSASLIPPPQYNPADVAFTRIYLAGPMSGLPDWNYPAFNAVAAKLRAEGCIVENPAENPDPACKTWRGYMRNAIAQLVTCNRIHLLPGWEKSRGALVEKGIAETLGMTISFEPEGEVVA